MDELVGRYDEVDIQEENGFIIEDLEDEGSADDDDIGFARQLREIYNKPVLRKGEDRELFREIQKGGAAAERAKQRLIEGVQQYVVKKARAFQGRGVPLEDLIQEGNMGVLTAIEKFDPSKGFAFLTYADDWIGQRMSRACTDRGSLEKYHMRMPCHMYMAIGRVQKYLPILEEQLGRRPTPEELSEYDARQRKKKENAISPSQAEMALEVLSRSTVSLDANWTNDDSEVSLAEAIADDRAADPLDDITSEEQRKLIWDAFNKLDDDERQVLSMRLGLNPQRKKYKQTEVCQVLNIRRSRLVSLEKRAKAKLKASPEFRELMKEISSELEAEPATIG